VKLFDGAWEHVLGFSGSRHDRHNFTDGAEDSRFEGVKRKLDYQTNFYLDTPSFAGAQHVFTALLEDENEEVLSQSAFTDVDRSIDTRGLAGQYQLALFDRVFLTGGARRDGNELFEDATTWKATAAYLLGETAARLKASYGTGVKNPTIFELFGFAANFQGNPDLRPEEAKGWDAGVEQSLFDGRLLAEAVYFERRIDKLIAGAGQTAVNLDGESRSRGLELSATASLLPGLDLRAAFTVMRTEDPSGAELPRRPGEIGSVNVSYRFLEDRALVDLGVVHNGSQRDFAFDALFNRSSVTLGSYTLVNLAGSYRLADGLELFGRVENLLDETYEEVLTYGAPGIAAYAGLRVRY
jgi:vitamin B12 transporter